MIIKKWLIAALFLIPPGALFAQHVDSLSYKKNKLYFGAQIDGGIGYGDLNVDHVPNNPGGLAYCISANLMKDHNFLKLEATHYGYFNFSALGGLTAEQNEYSDIYGLLIGRQLPIGPKSSFGIATGISQVYIAYGSGSYGGYGYPSTYQLNSVATVGVPIELSFTHTSANYMAWHLTYGINLNNKATEGVATFGFSFGKLREKLSADKKL